VTAEGVATGGEEEVGGVGMKMVVEWLPLLWQHLNKFIESHNSTDVTIGPRLFLSCPMELCAVSTWFTDLWNYSIIPYLLEAVREGIQTYGSRVAWTDPCDWVLDTCPFTLHNQSETSNAPALLHLRPEDVGFDSQSLCGVNVNTAVSYGEKKITTVATTGECDRNNDPLLSMLMRLQEAANLSGTTAQSAAGENNSAVVNVES